jgi:hypothetical protein
MKLIKTLLSQGNLEPQMSKQKFRPKVGLMDKPCAQASPKVGPCVG